MKIQLIRHGTLLIYINDKKILVDPMLSPKGSLSPVPRVSNQNFNPLVDLLVDTKDIINADAVLLTHTHRDHFDDEAIKLLSKNIPILCQPEDSIKIRNLGFSKVISIDESYIWNGITLSRTSGKHGNFIMSKKMGSVSGYILKCNDEPTLYIMGDTIWCSHVKKALKQHKPHIAISFSGAAKFSLGGPITMTCKDILKVYKNSPDTKIIAAHLEAWNHCSLSRVQLKNFIEKNNMRGQVLIPNDGEILNFKRI